MPLTAVDNLEAESAEREYVWTLNFGPQHPATHTTLRLVLTLDGERVLKAVPYIGYLHSGFEKLGEHLDFNQYVTIVDRMNYLSPLANEISWHHAVEKLLNIELTPRCKYLRTILAELMRMHDHLLNVGTTALDLGGFTAFLYFFQQREHIYDIVEMASGQRFHTSYTRVGGVLFDVNMDWINSVRKFIKEFPKVYDEVDRLLTKNRIFVDRTKGVGYLSTEDAVNLSASGPIARASGIERDLRRDEPYLAYEDLDFDVVCSKNGDCYARYLVRMGELVQSLKIIEQAIENIPGDPSILRSTATWCCPRSRRSIAVSKGSFSTLKSSCRTRATLFLGSRSTRRRNLRTASWDFYCGQRRNSCVSREDAPPSYIHFSMFPHMIKDHQLSDVVAVLGSLNIIAAELDR